ncbi:MAG: hypothetical protein ACPL5F_06375 [Moorellaceae bacterium]
MLYTEDPVVAEAASKNGLRRMAEYYRLQGDGRPVAWQFVGSKEKVLAGAKGVVLQSGGGEETKSETPEAEETSQPRESRRRNREKDEGGGQGRVHQLRLF